MLARPADAQKTSHAMGYENRRSCTRFHNSVQRRDPVVKFRSVPTRRLQPQCICFAFLPEGLPMLGAGVVETGKNQKRATHYFSLPMHYARKLDRRFAAMINLRKRQSIQPLLRADRARGIAKTLRLSRTTSKPERISNFRRQRRFICFPRKSRYRQVRLQFR